MDASHCTLTIDASQSMGPVRGLVMRPVLMKLFYGPDAPAATLLSGPRGTVPSWA